jgi:long-chain acyl-CoA synthetase
MLRRRNVCARIGPVLTNADFRRLTHGLSASEASRVVADLVRRAVLALSRGDVLDLARFATLGEVLGEVVDDSLEPLFRELEDRFVPGSVEETVTFYFALGDKERWTLTLDPAACKVLTGKAVDVADCVLKTSPEMFRRIVQEAYAPSPAEFMSGVVKSNNIAHLVTFQRAFNLEKPSRGSRPATWSAGGEAE